MHLLSEWRMVFAGFLLCVVISFVRGVLRKRDAAVFDVALVLLTIGLLAYALR